jgi:hypothetical protein
MSRRFTMLSEALLMRSNPFFDPSNLTPTPPIVPPEPTDEEPEEPVAPAPEPTPEEPSETPVTETPVAEEDDDTSGTEDPPSAPIDEETPEPDPTPEEPSETPGTDTPVAEEDGGTPETEDPPPAPEDNDADDTDNPTDSDSLNDETGGESSSNGAPSEISVPLASATEVPAGRVTTLDPGENVVSVRILEKPEVGNLTVNPDNTLALVLTGTKHSGPLSFEYEATYADGTTQTLTQTVDVTPLQQLKGWSTGENVYMLETDEAGHLVIEHGDNHRLVHISASDDALSAADIAALEGIREDQITAQWLMQNKEYGASPDMALDPTVGMRLWRELTELMDRPGSHWLLLERGHEYDIKRLIEEGTQGESELHPIYVGAYGDGAPPVLKNLVRVFQEPSANVVIEDLEFARGFTNLQSDNIILSDVISDGKGMTVLGADGFTLRNSTIHDAVADAPKKDVWSTQDRESGLFVGESKGLLVEGVHVDQVGWEDDYDYFGDPNFGQAPNMMSQNLYIQVWVEDVTIRDNISMRAASFGAQVRPGGFIEDNVFIDNNAALNAFGGVKVPDIDGVRYDHFSFITDNLVTSGGAKQVSSAGGALTWGMDLSGYMLTLLDNIVTHLADPNNPEEMATKVGNGSALRASTKPLYDDTIIYNWVPSNFPGNPDQRVSGIDTALADQTTIQNFTADLLGLPTATIDDLGEFLRTEFADGLPNTVTADDIIAYFQKTFGVYSAPRTDAETLRFVPNDLGDGVRWDNRINWTTDDLPGTIDGDSVDLGGNWVVFATITGTIQDFEFGSGGKLNVTSGRLNVDGATTAGQAGAEIDISGAGQLWLTGYGDSDLLDIDVTGGRFANLGDFTGTFDLDITGGQAILAASGASMTLAQGSQITVTGDAAKLGFDGDDGGIATLQVNGGRIDFVADASGFARIGEFRSGTFGDAPDVLSGIELGGGVLGLDMTALNDRAVQDTLLSADEILGSFDTFEFIGLAADRDATIIFDYDTDAVILRVTESGAGTGQTNVEFLGDTAGANTAVDIRAVLMEIKDSYPDTDPPIVTEAEEPTALVLY